MKNNLKRGFLWMMGIVMGVMMVGCQPEYVPDASLLPGTWKEGTVYYRFDDYHWTYEAKNGEKVEVNGVTWDEADDVTEAEGQAFQWELDAETLTEIHIMEMTGAGSVPKIYTILELTKMNLVYEDGYGRRSNFIRVK